MRQCRGQREMRKGEIAVGLDRAAEPHDRLVVFAEMQFRRADAADPVMRVDVARAQPQRLADMAFGFLRASQRGFDGSDHHVRVAEIAVERQRVLEFGERLIIALGQAIGSAAGEMRQGVVGRLRQCPDRRSFRGSNAGGPIVGQKAAARWQLASALPTKASVFAGSRASARSKKASACDMYSAVIPLFRWATPRK